MKTILTYVKLNPTKLSLVQVVFYAMQPGNGSGLFYSSQGLHRATATGRTVVNYRW